MAGMARRYASLDRSSRELRAPRRLRRYEVARAVSRQVALLRAVNVGPHRRLAMADLRAVVESVGYADVQTHLQSGNVVFRSPDPPGAAARKLEQALDAALGLEVGVLVRTAGELAEVVARDPLRPHVTDPRRYLVAFLSRRPAADRVAAVDPDGYLPERFSITGRELYLWLPDGVHQGPAAARAVRPAAGAGLHRAQLEHRGATARAGRLTGGGRAHRRCARPRATRPAARAG
jgi:uncharacterized protein (DUF1697 family)